MYKFFSVVFFIFLLQGCMVKERYPAVVVPESWSYFEEKEKSANYSTAFFWLHLKDPILDCLISKALEKSPDLKEATSRIAASLAHLSYVKADNSFEIDFLGNFTKDQTLFDPSSFGSPVAGLERVQQQNYSGVFNFSYEIDLWGKLKDRESAALSSVNASYWAYQFVYQTLVTEIARQYIMLRILDQDNAFLEKVVNLWNDRVETNYARVDAGLDPEIDLKRSLFEKYQAEADLENSLRARKNLEISLAVLLGVLPEEFSLFPGKLPEILPPLPDKLPVDILCERPDLQQSWMEVTSHFFLTRATQKLLFPSISIDLAGGASTPSWAEIITWQARYWQMVFNLFSPVIDRGRRYSLFQEEKARWTAFFYGYQRQVLNAFKDVEEGINDFRRRKKQYEFSQKAYFAAQEGADLANEQFNAGLINYLLVADQEVRAIDAERKSLALNGERFLSWIRLIKAFGVVCSSAE